MQELYIPAGMRDAIHARLLGNGPKHKYLARIACSWGQKAGAITERAPFDIAMWDLHVLADAGADQVGRVLSGFLGSLIQDSALWLAEIELHCLDDDSCDLLEASRVQVEASLKAATRGGLRTLAIHHSNTKESDQNDE